MCVYIYYISTEADSSSPWKKPGFYCEGNGVKLKYISTGIRHLYYLFVP